MIHRDLKAENCLVDSAGEPMIADLGLGNLGAATTAQRAEPAAEPAPEEGDGEALLEQTTSRLRNRRQRMLTLFCGTPRFMAPEVASGTEYDSSADVYSFGVLLVDVILNCSEESLAAARATQTADDAP